MILVLLVFLGGVLTILSPCILPVLPFVFARAEQPFLRCGLPMLIGMAVTFAGIASLAVVGGAWAVSINQYGRAFALASLAAFAGALMSRHLADWLARPFIGLGNRLLALTPASDSNVGLIHSLLLGAATGFLWAPCAGPILGLILTGAALSGPNVQTTFMLFVYAAGAATSLAFALLAGRRLFTALKQTFSAGEWIRCGLGIAVLLAVGAVTFGWDSSLLTRLSFASTNRLEQSLINIIDPRVTSKIDGSLMTKQQLDELPVEGEFPSLSGASSWLNSLPISPDSLRGKVVLIDFWTYSCINCLRSLPYVKAWYEKYKDYGLVVIGVHTPEFAFEKDVDNVRRATGELGLAYPIALDNNYDIWRAFGNQYWPAHYFIDAQGRIRSHHFSEGNYAESEQIIRQLLIEAGVQDLPLDVTDSIKAAGIQAASDKTHIQSEETYIGYERAENFISSAGFAPDQFKNYQVPSRPELNQWGLTGTWLVDKEKAVLGSALGKIIFRFKARDLHLVMGPGSNGKPVRFRVQLDDADPALDHGVDIDADGNGVIQEQRLYQRIRQSSDINEHTFSIEFFDSGVQAFAFTFG